MWGLEGPLVDLLAGDFRSSWMHPIPPRCKKIPKRPLAGNLCSWIAPDFPMEEARLVAFAKK